MQYKIGDLPGLIPSLEEILLLVPLFTGLCLFYLWLGGYLKLKKGFRTGYSRKVIHVCVFITAVLIQTIGDLGLVLLYGGIGFLVILFAVFKGDGHILFEGMAREQDEPHRAHFVIVPLFATAIGGLMANLLFGGTAVIGYLVAGLGDAAGEPVGTRFGKHRYRVPSFKRVKATRSIEGSAAVFLVSLAAIIGGLSLLYGSVMYMPSFLWILVVALASALIEAISPHGWDNLSMQLVPAALGFWLFSL